MDWLLGVLHLALCVYAILKIAGSGATTGTKVVWIVVVLVLPIVGLILWWLLGPK
jgi:phospholipase D-like protein